MRLELADLPTSRVASVGPVVWTRDAESGVAELSNLTPNAEDVGRFDVELYVEDRGFDGDGLDESR